MADELHRNVEKAKAALRNLDRAGVAEHVAAVRLSGAPRDRIEAVRCFDALRCELFAWYELAADPAIARVRMLAVLDELDYLAHWTREDGSVLPRIDRHWVLGQRRLLDSDFEGAFAALLPGITRAMRDGTVEALAAKPVWSLIERHEAKLLADATADLLRALREARPPVGVLSEARVQVADMAAITSIERLSAHPDLSRWSARRLLTRAAYECADRGQRPRAAAMLRIAENVLEPREAKTPLAQIDAALIAYELELLADEPDLAHAMALWDRALDQLAQMGFLRRIAVLQRLDDRIRRHGTRADEG